MMELMPLIHPVDQAATQIWFSFWPLKLARSLQSSADPASVIKKFQLDGNYRLDEQIDSSVDYFYSSIYWGIVKRTILKVVESEETFEVANLQSVIQSISSQVAIACNVDESVVLGIVAAGIMMLQQIGLNAFQASINKEKPRKPTETADEAVRTRGKSGGSGLRRFLGIPNRKFTITFEPKQPDAKFVAMNGQDLSMASSTDRRDFRGQDHRRAFGPIPAECRSGACGYCWIGIRDGEENLSEMTEFERKRLKHFGYVSDEAWIPSHPRIRLACQAKCGGNMTIVIPPWNGVLCGRRS
jgi:ferredoxin